MLKIYVTVLKKYSEEFSYNTPSGCTTILVTDVIEDNFNHFTHFTFEGDDDHYQYFLKLKSKLDLESPVILSVECFEQ